MGASKKEREPVNIFLQSVDKKQDVFGIFTNWFQQEFDLPVSSLDVKRNEDLGMFYSV